MVTARIGRAGELKALEHFRDYRGPSNGGQVGLATRQRQAERVSSVDTYYENALSELGVGQDATVFGLELAEEVQHHLMHMGFVPGARVTALRRAPAGDPTVYAIDGLEIALRRETARSIRIRKDGDVLAAGGKEGTR